jgi:hypothetical protein
MINTAGLIQSDRIQQDTETDNDGGCLINTAWLIQSDRIQQDTERADV